MSRRPFSTIIFLILLIVIGQAISPDRALSKERFIIKFATVAPEGSTWMNYMRQLDKALREKSGGQIGFQLYAGGIAGDELDVLRKIRIGQIHSAAFSGLGIAQILPMVRVLDLPFLFRSNEEADLVRKELRDLFSKNFNEKGFEFLSWVEIGKVHLFSKKPIRKMADLSGLKIWTWSGDPISKETFSAMGTNPIPLTITDVTTALNTGMIDTFYAPPLGALALQWHTHVKFMTSLPLAHSTGVLLISRNFLTKIPPDLSQTLKNEFEHNMSALTSELRKQTEESIMLLQKSGIEITPMPSETDLKEFYKVHDLVAQKLAGEIYPKELLNRVYGILKRSH
ncbi:MAG: TRAP transporter substrate-binding protein DctP [Pseudomonadota bacterium]